MRRRFNSNKMINSDNKIKMNLIHDSEIIKHQPSNESTSSSSDSGVIIIERTDTNRSKGYNKDLNPLKTKIETEIRLQGHTDNEQDNNNDKHSIGLENIAENNINPTITSHSTTTTTNKDFLSNNRIKIENVDDSCDDERTSSSLSSPPHSLHSHNISIVSLNDDADSSVIDSDSDFSDAPPGDFIIQKLGQHPKNGVENDGIVIINQNLGGQEPSACTSNGIVATTTKPQIGSIAVQNSTDITFGNKTFYQGPVTIKQFLLENKKWKPTSEGGTDNEGFEGDDGKKLSTDPKTDSDSLNHGLRKKFMLHSKPVFITGLLILISVVLCAVIFTTLAFMKSSHSNKLGDGDDSRKNIPVNSTIGDDHITGGRVLRLISRDEWIAQPANNELTPLNHPIKNVVITHTATEGCKTQAECVFRIRYIQTFHMESRNWDDIAYNFLVGGDGAAYEGRGWDKMGAHTKGYNSGSIGVAFMGTFTKNEPPQSQIRAALLIIEEGVRLGKLSPDYKVFGHRQLIATESPGEALYKIIKTWPHWSDQVEDF